MTIAVYPGTFDPITKGHIDIIVRASKFVDKLIVSPAKDTLKNPIFSQEERVELIEHEIKSQNLSNVIVLPFKGLIVNFLKEQKATLLIRGIRGISDFDNEFTMANMNKKLHNNIDTVFLPALESFQFISSTLVRQIAMLHGNIEEFVSENVKNKIMEKLNNKSN